MKKFGLLVVGGIAAMILLSTIGPMVGFAISLILLYFIVKQFLKSESVMGKVGLGFLGAIVLLATFHNVPAVIGVTAAYVLYLVYKKWNEGSRQKASNVSSGDPFANFEKQWNELKNN